jgi:hypothetical protein
MSLFNLDNGYGLVQSRDGAFTFGKKFYVTGTTYANNNNANFMFRNDPEGTIRFYSSATAVTDALASCVAGRGDIIFIDPSYSTPLTATELLNAETKNVSIIPAGRVYKDGTFFANKATATLPATTTGTLFTVTGRVNVLQIIGEVTTALGATVTNLKLTSVPTVGSTVDLCANGAVASLALGTQLTITGTPANALVATNGASVTQASALMVKAGTISAVTDATNTGSVKWKVIYTPIDPGAMII